MKLFLVLLALFLSQSCIHKSEANLTLSEMQHHKMTKVLRKTFDFYSRINCPDAATKGARSFDRKQFLMLREKFLVLHIEKNEFDEYVMHIAIAPKNRWQQIRMWRLVLSESEWEKSGYEIIKFDEYEFKSLEGKKWPFDEEHLGYWVEPEF